MSVNKGLNSNSYYYCKDTIKKVKKQATDWENIPAMYICIS